MLVGLENIQGNICSKYLSWLAAQLFVGLRLAVDIKATEFMIFMFV